MIKDILKSKAMRVVMENGVCKGGLKYVRAYILLTLLSVDSVEDESELSRISGCGLDQCKSVLDTLKEYHFLTLEKNGRLSLRVFKNSVFSQEITPEIILSEEEEKHLRAIMGSEFIFYKNMALNFKLSLIEKQKTINISDYCLVIKAFKNKWGEKYRVS